MLNVLYFVIFAYLNIIVIDIPFKHYSIYVTLFGETSHMVGEHKAGFRREGHICIFVNKYKKKVSVK